VRAALWAVAFCATATACTERDTGPPSSASAAAALEQPPALAAGQAQYWRDEHDSARTTFQSALADARARDDSTGMALALHWLGLASYKLTDLSAAHGYYDSSLRLKLALGLKQEYFASYNAMGLLAWWEGHLARAESLFTLAQSTEHQVGDGAKLDINRSLIQVETGNYASAREGFTRALDATRSAGNVRDEGKALANLAMLDIREGNAPPALPRLAEARQRYAELGYVSGEVDALGQRATALQLMGEYQEAIAAADSALDLARRHSLKQEEAANLDVLSGLYAELGDDVQALRMLELAQQIYSGYGAQVELGSDLRRGAELRLRLGQGNGAVDAGREALRIHVEVGAHPERLADLLFLAKADSAGATGWLEQAQRLADSLGRPVGRAAVATTRASLAVRDRRWTPALSALREPLRRFDSLSLDERWRVAGLAAAAERGLGHSAPAERWARAAVAAVELVRGNVAGARSRSEFVASRSETYTQLVEILLAQKRVEEAFEVSDAARGRALLEHLGSYESGAGDSTLRRLAGEERSLNRIAALTRELEHLDESEVGSERETRLETSIDRLRGEYERGVRDGAAGSAPGSAQILGKGPVATAEVVAGLRPDEAILEYLIGPERVHAFLVTPAGVRHQVLAVAPADLASRIRLVVGLLSRPGDPAATHAPLASLHQSLLGDLGSLPEWAGARVVYIVPHGVIGLAPFAALRNGETGRYLIEDRAVATVASAATLVAIRRARAATVGASTIAAFAPFPGALPGSAEEIRRIERRGGKVIASRGRAATESAIRHALDQGFGVHLASHGLLNPDNPLFSRIELYPGKGADPGADGRLEAYEILGLRLKSPLVYLSGCETGLVPAGFAPAGRGEEYVSLAQAFLYAGAAGVVATMWRIPDSGSVPLVAAFYRALDANGPLIALAVAQREVLAGTVHAHPYYWAGHVYSGDRLDRANSQVHAVKSNWAP